MMERVMGRVTVVLDAQAGSCGKGKVVGYLANKENRPMVAIDNFMTNAGHTFVADDGRKIMTQHLPSSIINPSAILCIGPGAAITYDVLMNEILKYDDLIGRRPIHIHPRAMVIQPQHVEKEKELVRSGSTFKGCGVAQADKIMRVPGTKLFGDWYEDRLKVAVGMEAEILRHKIVVTDTARIINYRIDCGDNVIVEGSQGFDLDINYGLSYPHTTSRQCHAGQLLADCGISPRLVTDIVMVMRPYPIRISNKTNIGIEVSSGDYDGSKEITWDEVRKRCGAPDDIEFGEMTTVTKKVRRVFEMNWNRLMYAVAINRPTAIALNFAQYLDWNIAGATDANVILDSHKVMEFIRKVESNTGVRVRYVGTGAKNCEMVEI